jgi:hypothetical protein
MRLGADRDRRQSRDPDSYWRRRFFILGGGIAVLAVLAYQFTGVRPGPAAGADAASRSSAAATLTPDALPSAAYGSPWAAPTPPGHHPGPSPSASSSATPPAAAVARCAPADVVLSLFPGQPAYPRGTRPRFDVFAVSTAVAQCQLAFGPGSVRVIVTRHGRVVWDSAACGQAAAPAVQFKLGVPQLLTLVWNTAAKRPAGCAGSLSPGEWGTFEAVAMGAAQASPVRSFKLLP